MIGSLANGQKYIKVWKVDLKDGIAFPISEAYGLPINAKILVRSVKASFCDTK